MDFNINFFLQLVVNGLLLGGFYATMALGFSTIWGVMRLINLAHGEFLIMGGLVSWFLFNGSRRQEQVLTVGVDDPTVTLIVMAIIAILVGLLLAEFNFFRQKIKQDWPRRVAGIIISLIVAGIAYLIWRGQDFPNIDISMMFMVFVGLGLSIGFIISHMVFGNTLEMNNIWRQRAIGYGVGAIASLIVYSLWRSADYPPIDPFLSLFLVFPIFFALGYVLQRGFLNRIVEGPYLTMLLVTFAISIILQNIGLQIYAADPRKINIDYGTALSLGEVTIAPAKLITIIVSVVMIAGLVLFQKRTRTGYAIRAAAQNKMAARLMGIDIKETYAITFGISLALTALAGGMMATFQPIAPVNGPPWTLRAFAIVALGGLGNVQGVIVGGFVLGLAESFMGGYIGTGWAIAASFIVLVVTLVLRPQGITGGLVPVEG